MKPPPTLPEFQELNYMTYKLLVQTDDSTQEIINVEETGSYYDETKILWDERIDGELPSVTLGAMKRIGNNLIVDNVELESINTRELQDKKSRSLKLIDGSSDELITAAIGRRDTEYLQAEKQAQEFIAAGYKGNTYPYVSSWAIAKNETNEWAADNIIETATAWREVQSDLRAKRLMHKENVRNSETQEEIDAVMTSWGIYINALKQSMESN